MDALTKALSIIGGQSALAGVVTCSPQVVNNWVRRKRVPESACPAIESATKGAVTSEDLRPDINWVRVPDKTWPHPKGRPLVDHSGISAAHDAAPVVVSDLRTGPTDRRSKPRPDAFVPGEEVEPAS